MESEAPGEEVAGRRGVSGTAVVEIGRGEAEAEQRRRVEAGDGAVGTDLTGIEGRVAGHHDTPVGLAVGEERAGMAGGTGHHGAGRELSGGVRDRAGSSEEHLAPGRPRRVVLLSRYGRGHGQGALKLG